MAKITVADMKKEFGELPGVVDELTDQALEQATLLAKELNGAALLITDANPWSSLTKKDQMATVAVAHLVLKNNLAVGYDEQTGIRIVEVTTPEPVGEDQ